VIVVTNPLDVMAYMAYKTTGFKHEKVLGMAGVLDSARLIDFIAKRLNVKRSDINATVLGSHGDLMVPAFSQTKLNGKPLSDFLSQKDLGVIAELTKNAGAEIVSLLGTGSAYYGPAASVVEMVNAILLDKKTTHCVCSYLQGEYGLRDVYIGVPCVLGKNGIERVVELKLERDEAAALAKAAESIKAMIRKLDLS
jgi:malate dehydrogenase